MVVFSIALFTTSLALVIALFACKYIEMRRGIVFVPEWRDRADEKARELKALAFRAEERLERLPAILFALIRFGIHGFALSAAHLARSLEEKAHQLADFVSHKRGFERREAHSEFLKKVGEVKNGDGRNGTNGVSSL
ncbi:hypothetical protein A2673_03510 [Candidatus Kaiserbacteria bacterium RIFCSPHIGHO2_01_FULL_50_13]|uniref:Uncharacterized protein n=1 Tax=Candidatus Kaiserbacteria bacterium RIFCSPLOWO2_01_FULL_50_24 TaxID=1798507 RepID=A0A1F6EMP3_9BACT|nr:MAG: hypothetical protein A2673_03510 [Candidatus Kaiserbacteria bacterium RIFCSPHIGHO2_01_FULL_50_13]OGG74895.1 MAG: hypothetical protein A3A34_03690 [Candidatus Kaiserbacteria bacterium RIFCSPLOWO2_01_FULL_50_24]OGG81632.1 MAG: hypothetical protein A3H74_01470 [Candidatus Kaiserbacteria bacterium RIFCSPLOWO2_02_FULL_51_13]